MPRHATTRFGRCPECGYAMRVTGSFRCAACGYVGWSAEDFVAPASSPRRTPVRWLIGVLLLAFLLLAVCSRNAA